MAHDRIAFAHILRGVAALCVLLFHYCGVFWAWPDVVAALIHAPPLPGRQGPEIASRLFDPGNLLNAGHFGLALFFLVSGFVIPFSFERQSRRGFVIARAMRLWPTYAAGLTLTLASLWLIAIVYGRAFPYSVSTIAWNYALGLRELASVPSIDGIVWTLEIEIIFYALCVLLAGSLRSGKAGAVAFAGGLLAVASLVGSGVSQQDPTNQLAYTLVTASRTICYILIGTLFHLHFRQSLGPGRFVLLAAGTFGVFAGLWTLSPQSPQAASGTVSYGVALVVFAVCFLLRDRIRHGGILSNLADISYPLYVVHAVPGYVVMRLGAAAGLPPWACLVSAAALAIVGAWALHLAIEVRTTRLGRRWGQLASTCGSGGTTA